MTAMPHALFLAAVASLATPALVQEPALRAVADPAAHSNGGHLVVGVSDLDFADPAPSLRASFWLRSQTGPALLPRVVVDGRGAVLGTPPIRGGTLQGNDLVQATIAIDGESVDGLLTGTLFLPTPNARSMRGYAFTIQPSAVRESKRAYRAAHAAHYRSLRDAGVPGAAWFRSRAAANGAADDVDERTNWTRRGAAGADDTFAMFTGGRAVSENLRLDDIIDPAELEGVELVALDSIDGVRVPEMQWDGLIDGLDPEIDPLASAIPADQHAVFFPSFDSLVRVADALADESKPFVHLADGRAEDSLVRARYEAQLCVSLDGLTRRFGGQLVRSAALTGSDPYLRTGSDVALLLEGNTEAIAAFVRASMETTDANDAEQVDLGGATAFHVWTPDRRVDSWLVELDDVVIVSNSRVQVERLLAAHSGAAPSLDALPETVFFRDRYRRGEEGEDAFVLVSDAAIRRWASPKWRIASARRTRAGAVLADADAWHVAGELGVSRAESPALANAFAVDDVPIARDETYGTRLFMTPIVELDFDEVTPAEQQGYERWRRGYEASWGAAFDPLAVRISTRDDGIDADLSIMPLTVRTQYRWMVDLAGAAKLEPGVGDPHDGTIMHWVSAIDPEGRTYRELSGILRSFGRGDDMGIDWLGDHVSVYLDHDPEYFERVKDADSLDVFTEEMLPGLPFGLHVDVDNGLGLAGFLTGLRIFADEAVPGLLDFETREHAGRKYVAIVVNESFGFDETPTIFYAVLPGALCTSFSERVVRGAIDRAYADDEEGEVLPEDGWAGHSTAMRIGGAFKQAVAAEMIDIAVRDRLRARSWSNLAILNDYRRLGIVDPVAYHERRWGARLVCPGGGEYVWNAEHGSMESTAYGHPAAPKDGPLLPPAIESLRQLDFGLDFERLDVTPAELRDGQRARRNPGEALGLRARARLRR